MIKKPNDLISNTILLEKFWQMIRYENARSKLQNYQN